MRLQKLKGQQDTLSCSLLQYAHLTISSIPNLRQKPAAGNKLQGRDFAMKRGEAVCAVKGSQHVNSGLFIFLHNL